MLKSVDISKLKIKEEKNKILVNPLKMKSAYSENLRNILNVIRNTNQKKDISDLITKNNLNDIDVYGIKLNIDRIDSTLNFIKDFTLEPPITFFAKNLMTNVDFIFYSGNIEVIRVLNTPDVFLILEMKGLPNNIYPSDHISITADFILN